MTNPDIVRAEREAGKLSFFRNNFFTYDFDFAPSK